MNINENKIRQIVYLNKAPLKLSLGAGGYKLIPQLINASISAGAPFTLLSDLL